MVPSRFHQEPLSNELVFPHPSLLQPPLPTTPTPVPREPSRKPLPVSPSTDGLRSPSPPPRSCVPAPRPSAPDLSPTRVSAFLLHLLSCCGEAELSLCSEAKARSDPCPSWGSSSPWTLLLSLSDTLISIIPCSSLPHLQSLHNADHCCQLSGTAD